MSHPCATSAAAVIALFCGSLATVASAQPIVDAGPDLRVGIGDRIRMNGSVTSLSPINFWTGDGDHTYENYLVKYSSVLGTRYVGPLKDSSGKVYGWPADFEAIQGMVYGFDVFDRYLYTLDGGTGLVTPVGKQVSYTRVYALAYDQPNDKLYAVDEKTRKVLLFDRSTGSATSLFTLPSSQTDIHGLAYRESDGKLYYCDQTTAALYRVDPATGSSEFLFGLPASADVIFDELTFYEGRLFASYRTYDASVDIWSMQLMEIDLDTGELSAQSPVLTDLSAHALLIISLPERIRWTQLSGPGKSRFIDPTNPKTDVVVTKPGLYTFELRAHGANYTVSDTVTVKVGSSTPANHVH